MTTLKGKPRCDDSQLDLIIDLTDNWEFVSDRAQPQLVSGYVHFVEYNF